MSDGFERHHVRSMEIAIAASAALMLVASVTVGCAHGMGSSATEGAIAELRQQRQENLEAGKAPVIEQAARIAVGGTLEELTDPSRQEQINQIVTTATEGVLSSAVQSLNGRGAWGGGPVELDGTRIGALGRQFSTGFYQGMSQQLQLELGPEGSGALAKSLSALVQEMSSAAATGAVAELSSADPECQGPNRKQCLDRRVYEISRIAAAGFTEGMESSLRIPSLVMAFAVGLLVALLAVAAMRGRRRAA